MSNAPLNPNLKFKAQIILVHNGYIFEFESATESQSFVAVNNEELCEMILGCLPREWSSRQIEEMPIERAKPSPEPTVTAPTRQRATIRLGFKNSEPRD